MLLAYGDGGVWWGNVRRDRGRSIDDEDNVLESCAL